jgi:hypothetical protein
MEFEFGPLFDKIDRAPQSIKPELFSETAAIIQDLCHRLGTDQLAPAVAPSVRALSESMQDESGPPTQYFGLHALLDTSMFIDMASGATSEASHLHFRQLLNVLQAIVPQVPAPLDQAQIYMIQHLLNRQEIHRSF